VRILIAFAALVGVATGIGWLVAGALGAVIAGAGVLLAGVSLYARASACVLHLAGAYPMERDAAPDLHCLVERLAAQASLLGAAPRLYWLPGDAPNALVTGRDPAHAAIARTPDLPALLERDELAGLLARELACLTRDATRPGDIAAALAGRLMLIACWPAHSRRPARPEEPDRKVVGQWSVHNQGDDAFLRLVLASIAAGVVRAASSAERVHAADTAGAQMLSDPLPLARALAKLAAANGTRPACEVNPGLAHQFVVAPYIEESLRPLFSIQPSSSARLQRLTRQALLPAVNPG
jgi:heat shock protein HtpX